MGKVKAKEVKEKQAMSEKDTNQGDKQAAFESCLSLCKAAESMSPGKRIKVRDDIYAFMLEHNFDTSQVNYLIKTFSKASGFDIPALKSEWKEAKATYLLAQSQATAGLTKEVIHCLELCKNTLSLTPDKLRTARREIYQFMFNNAFEKPEIELVISTLSNVTGAGIRALQSEWQNAKQALLQIEADLRWTGIDTYPYSVRNNTIYLTKRTFDGEVDTPLCNFFAQISQEIVYDDGAEKEALYLIEGNQDCGKPLPAVKVASKSFASLNWVFEWNHGPIVYAGQGTKDHLRTAVQILSKNVKARTIYAHTGWRKMDSQWYYLHTGGAIGIEELTTEIEVELGDRKEGTSGSSRLKDYDLSAEDTHQVDTKTAIRASLKLLKLGPKTLMLPLLCAIYRAPLCEALVADFGIFLAGLTGTFKTEITALAQAHFGSNWNGRNLPTNWTATANALEKQAFLIKDSLMVIDDYCPTGSQYEVSRYVSAAERIFRAQGNRAGRERMRGDGGLRPTYFPRGIVMSSGEDLPKGQSLRARILFLEVQKGDIDQQLLTLAQAAANEGLYSQSMAAYNKHLAPQIDELKIELPQLRQELRAKAAQESSHMRVPDQVASMAIGLQKFLGFALEEKAITQTECQELWQEGWEILMEVAAKQSQYQATEDPVTRFGELLSAALVSGHAHLESAETRDVPKNPERYGWRRVSSGMNETWQSQGECIGWLGKDDQIYLQPETAYKCAQNFARVQGDNISMAKNTLYKRMGERNLILINDKGRQTTKQMIGKVRERVIYIDPCLLLESGASGASGAEEKNSNQGQG